MASQAKKRTVKKSSSTKKNTKKSSVKKSSTSKASPKKSLKKTVKKSRKQKSVKKSSPKTRVKRDAHPDQIFIMVDGKRVKNIKELADVMEEIEDYVFNHHVSEHNNDFENWLKHVFEEIALAKKIAGCKDKKHVQFVLYKHISHKLW